jgi:hypothetical protein
MAEREVQSPDSRKGSKVGSHPRLGPGSRSGPSRGSGPQTDNVLPQQSHVSRHAEPPLPSSSPVAVGPEDE